MTLWFLSLFPAFRSLRDECARLREALQSATTQSLILQDRLDSAVEDRNKLWDLTRHSIDNERAAFQMQINVAWQRQGFGAPYPEAPTIPSDVTPPTGGGTAGRKTVQMPSSRVAAMTQGFIREVMAGKQ